MKKNIFLGTALAALCVTSFAGVAKDKSPGSGPNPFSDCGIGAALFADTKWAAVTSNVIWDVGTTAVTSATASPETCNGVKVKTAKFIIDNYDNISEEIAKGSGEHLNAMYKVLGCSEDVRGSITTEVRSSMATIVSTEAYQQQNLVEKASGLYDAVNTSVEGNYQASCSA